LADYGLVQIRYNRVRPSGQPAEDVMVNTLHMQTSAGGFTSDDRDSIDDILTTFWTAFKPYVSGGIRLQEYRFYNLPSTVGPAGDPAFTVTKNLAGTGSSAEELPNQVAMTVTWQTDIRRRWGRIYLPPVVINAIDTGRFANGFVDIVAAAVDAMGTQLIDNGTGLVVWNRQSWTPTHIIGYRVDDVPDVIRRRRLSQKFHFVDGTFTS
jgi:hypothetical protein